MFLANNRKTPQHSGEKKAINERFNTQHKAYD
jgi:hypothetical protein